MKWGVLVVVALLAVSVCGRLVDIREVDKIVFGKDANKMVQRNTMLPVDEIVCTAMDKNITKTIPVISWKCDAVNSTNIISRVFTLDCYSIVTAVRHKIDTDMCTLEFDMIEGLTAIKTLDSSVHPIVRDFYAFVYLLQNSYRNGLQKNLPTLIEVSERIFMFVIFVAVGCTFIAMLFYDNIKTNTSTANATPVVPNPVRDPLSSPPATKTPECRNARPTEDVEQPRKPKNQHGALREERKLARRLLNWRRAHARD